MKKTISKKQLLLCILFFATLNIQAQQKIKDGTGTPATSLPTAGSILEIQSTQAGLRFPQVSLTDTKTWGLLGSGAAATSPGMTVYNTNAGITNVTADVKYPANSIGEYYWDGTGWVSKNATTAQNTAIPLVLKDSPISRVIRKMTGSITGSSEGQEKRRRFSLFG